MLRRDSKATFEWNARGMPGCSMTSGILALSALGVVAGSRLAPTLARDGPGEHAALGWTWTIAIIVAMGLAGGVVGVILGLLFAEKKYCHLHSGNYQSKAIEEKQYRAMAQKQMVNPCLIMAEGKRAWWWFQDEIYWEDENLSETAVKALVLERKRKRERRIQRAIALMEQEGTDTVREREPIPDDVKMFVWQRDEGKCVKCGGRTKLEFDHIIPLAMGGSNTARNIQLLCETCNRAKGGSLA